MNRYADANELLQQQLDRDISLGRRGDWWYRLAVNLSHLKRASESLVVCERALADPYVRSGDRLKLEKRLVRLCKPPARWKVPTHLLHLSLLVVTNCGLILQRSLTKTIREPK